MYLHELFMQGFLQQEEMLNYFQYLEYWRQPQYVRFIVYVLGYICQRAVKAASDDQIPNMSSIFELDTARAIQKQAGRYRLRAGVGENRHPAS